jgi:hypothetical protein
MASANRFLLFVTVFLLGLLSKCTEAFVKGSSRVNACPVFASETSLGAAKKKATPKAVEVETLRKADIVAAIAERMDCTKADAEKALAAVVGTVQDVSGCCVKLYLSRRQSH